MLPSDATCIIFAGISCAQRTLRLLHEQERLTEHYQAGRFKLSDDDERNKYLSMQFLLKEYLEDKKQDGKP